MSADSSRGSIITVRRSAAPSALTKHAGVSESDGDGSDETVNLQSIIADFGRKDFHIHDRTQTDCSASILQSLNPPFPEVAQYFTKNNLPRIMQQVLVHQH